MPIQPTRRDAQRIYNENVLGVVVNLNQTHWVAFKYVDNTIWLLNSETAPTPYTFPQYLAYIKRYRHAFALENPNDDEQAAS